MLDELSDLVTEQMRSWAVSGISIGLLDGDRVETATFGIVSIATNQPVTPETLFQIGSISKVFTQNLPEFTICAAVDHQSRLSCGAIAVRYATKVDQSFGPDRLVSTPLP
jgi:hypothetical protein